MGSMGPPKKSRFVNKRLLRDNGDWPDKNGIGSKKSTIRKRKLPDMLGSPWSKEELEHFYDAYRTHGEDWKKIAGTIRSRSLDMVEALYNMNKAYLSLPEGIATAAGLIAMMTDYYNNEDGSNSDGESNQVLKTTCKSQKRGHWKLELDMPKRSRGSYPDALQNQSGTLSSGCLSLLGNDRIGDVFGGSRPSAVGKRTPRIPLWRGKSQRDDVISPNKLASKSRLDAVADVGAHVAALALAEAAKRGGSAQVSQTPEGREEHVRSTPLWNGKTRPAGSEMANIDSYGVGLDGDLLKGSLGRKEVDNGISIRGTTLPNNEGSDAGKIQQNMKELQDKRSRGSGTQNCHFDGEREAFSVTGEAFAEGKTSSDLLGRRKISCHVLSPDESCALEALQTLADLCVNSQLPASAAESELSVHANERKRNIDSSHTTNNIRSTLTKNESGKSGSAKRCRRSISTVRVDASPKGAKLGKNVPSDKKQPSKAKQPTYSSIGKTQKKKQKSLSEKFKTPKAGTYCESHPDKFPMDEASVEREKTCLHQPVPLSRQGQTIHTVDQPSLSANLGRTVTDLCESTSRVSSLKHFNMPTGTRSKLKLNLKRAMVQRDWKSSDRSSHECCNKHPYSVGGRAVDLKEKLSHCLSSQMLRRWCAFEWFYSAIDYPWFARREFVEYLNHVRLGHVPQLTRVEWSIIRSSLGKPRRLSSQFLFEEREKLEQYRESVRTHYAELRAGVREGFPSDLARPLSIGQRVIARHPKTREIHDGSILALDRSQYRIQFDRPDLGIEFVLDIDCMPLNLWVNMPEVLKKQNCLVNQFCNSFTDRKSDGQWKMGDSTKYDPNKSSKVANASCPIALSNFRPTALSKQAKVDTTSASVVAKDTGHDIAAAASQPCMLSQIQAREAEIRSLAELFRAPDKKEALVVELRHMSKEVSGIQIDGDLASNSEHFRKKQYAMVLLQLQEATDKVASALLEVVEPSGPFDNFDLYNDDSMPHVVEVVESSRLKARNMVDVAVQAMSSLENGEYALTRIGEASCISEPATTHVHSPQVQSYSDVTGAQIPSELISACVATFLMIQTCTERRHPPAEVARIVESAVASLQPCCSQNIPIYREIETCMGIIKNQMLALIPMPNTSLPAGVSK